ncbi:MAG: FAD-dependent oxidoreductase [Nitrospirae bacterium]|nr:FAD-dependent oxidoreductase [Nitrospirota bacterium]
MTSCRDNSRKHSSLPFDEENNTVILGGGLAGLSAGLTLTKAGRPVLVFESSPDVGGLSKTVIHGDFRFDLGGHRFLTKDKKIERFVLDLLDGEFLNVSRKSKIFMRNKFFDYPLRPSNAIFGLGVSTTLKAISDYSREKIKGLFIAPPNVSLEDWVVSNFGRTMFDLYFKDYSEKVWGIECKRISQEWVSQRIKGLSMWVAIKNAFFKFSGRDVDTLTDEFIYPPMGIGQISDKLKTEIEKKNHVLTNTAVSEIYHDNFIIKGLKARNCDRTYNIEGRDFVSSIPMTSFVRMLSPSAPEDIHDAAAHLKYRDLVIVTIMLNREKITDLTWLYLPDDDIPLGRIHEPKNWSPHMAPEGKTHIVSEYFCFKGDRIWNSSDEELTQITLKQMERLGFLEETDLFDSCVIRVPKAYPLFDVDYPKHYVKVLRYLENFKNLHAVGRAGMFRYYNMDHTIASGIDAAERIIQNSK